MFVHPVTSYFPVSDRAIMLIPCTVVACIIVPIPINDLCIRTHFTDLISTTLVIMRCIHFCCVSVRKVLLSCDSESDHAFQSNIVSALDVLIAPHERIGNQLNDVQLTR